MRGWRNWAWLAAIAAGACAGLAAADDGYPNRYSSLFSKGSDKPTPAPAKVEKSQPREKDAAAVKSATPKVADPAVERGREEAAFLRRSEACAKLMEIAVRKEDKELMRLAEQLDQRAWANYSRRTAHLPSTNASLDENVLAKQLGPKDKEKSNAVLLGKPNKDRDGQASVREVKP